MPNDSTRREFLKRGATAAVGTAAVGALTPQAAADQRATGPGDRGSGTSKAVFDRQKGAHLKLSCCAYSFNRLLPRGNKPGKMTMADFVDLCARMNLDGTELTSYYFPPDADTGYFKRIRRRAFLNGLEVTGTAVGNTFTLPPGRERDKQVTMVKHWIDRAVDLAAPTIRIFAGRCPKGKTIEQARKWFIECLEHCLPLAEKRGVFLALENHGGIVTTSEETLACLGSVASDWFGLNLDTGNLREPDPYAGMAKCAPLAVNVHVKVNVHSTTTGSAPADYDRIVAILRSAGYRGCVSLEYEAREDPHVAVPKHLDALRAAINKRTL